METHIRHAFRVSAFDHIDIGHDQHSLAIGNVTQRLTDNACFVINAVRHLEPLAACFRVSL
jgi:hypothetical protein